MGYIDKELNIKTAKALGKYISKETNKDIMVIKVANHLKVIWAIDSKLHTHNINASVIYIVSEAQVNEAIKVINNTKA